MPWPATAPCNTHPSKFYTCFEHTKTFLLVYNHACSIAKCMQGQLAQESIVAIRIGKSRKTNNAQQGWNSPSRVVSKLGKCPDSVGYVLRIELGNEDKALINGALQEMVVWSEAKCGKSPQRVLDSLRSEVLQLRHGSRHDSTQQWHSCSTGSAFSMPFL